MCLSISDQSMLGWLQNQLRIITAWKTELVQRQSFDIAAVERLEQHEAWLADELNRLARHEETHPPSSQSRVAAAPIFMKKPKHVI